MSDEDILLGKELLAELRRIEGDTSEIIETRDLRFKTAYEGWTAAGMNPDDLERFGLTPAEVYEPVES